MGNTPTTPPTPATVPTTIRLPVPVHRLLKGWAGTTGQTLERVLIQAAEDKAAQIGKREEVA